MYMNLNWHIFPVVSENEKNVLLQSRRPTFLLESCNRPCINFVPGLDVDKSDNVKDQ